MRRARLLENLEEGAVECGVCERRFRVKPGRTGICGNYLNAGGELYH